MLGSWSISSLDRKLSNAHQTFTWQAFQLTRKDKHHSSGGVLLLGLWWDKTSSDTNKFICKLISYTDSYTHTHLRMLKNTRARYRNDMMRKKNEMSPRWWFTGMWWISGIGAINSTAVRIVVRNDSCSRAIGGHHQCDAIGDVAFLCRSSCWQV